MKKALIVYYSLTGNTKKAAKSIGEGMRNKGVEATIKKAGELSLKDVESHDIVVFGSPTHLLKPVSDVIEAIKRLDKDSLKGKCVSAFATMSLIGGDGVIKYLEGMLREKGAENFVSGVAIRAGPQFKLTTLYKIPIPLIKGFGASPKEVERCKTLGERLVQ